MLSVYTNQTVNKFITQLSEHANIAEDKLVVKLVEDTVTKRLEKKRTHINKEGEEVESTLNYLKMCHNANILLDEVDPNEVEPEEGQEAVAKKKEDDGDEQLSDTETMRTIIGNADTDIANIERI